MIALTCAETGSTVYFNPDRILVLEEGMHEYFLNNEHKTRPCTRVTMGEGYQEFWAVKESPQDIREKIRAGER